MKKLVRLLICVVLVVLLTVPVFAESGKSDDIVILYTNDIHTYIDKDLSYDVLAALKDDLETKYEYVLLVDAGDHIQGTAYGAMDQGKTIINLMNAAGYDAATLGNHEFDYGMSGFMAAKDWANFPYLCANFYHVEADERGDTVLNPYQLFECGDLDVAIVGMTTPESFSAPAYFQNEKGEYIYGISGGADGKALYADVQAAIDAAKTAGAEIVIGLGHLGEYPSGGAWTGAAVIANTTGLDALIDGHSHSTVEGKLVSDKAGEPVLQTQTGQYFDTIGMMVIDAETGALSTELLSLESEALVDLLPVEDVTKIKTAWMASVDEQLSQSIGAFSKNVTFTAYDEIPLQITRYQETNAGDFSADALYYLFDDMGMDVDIAVMNGGGILNKYAGTMGAGERISYKTCKQINPFGNVACLQTVTGQQILDALEWGCRGVTDRENPPGSFLQVSGLKYSIDTQIESTVQTDPNNIKLWSGAPTGAYRVHSVEVFNKETGCYEALDLTAKYNLAGYSYTLRNGGDGFVMFSGADLVLDYVMEDYMVLANYVKGFKNCIVDAKNSPLAEKYPAMLLDYGSATGSGRIVKEPRVMEPSDQPVYVPVQKPAAKEENLTDGFNDLDADSWYQEAVEYVLEKGLMNGVGDGKFDPHGTTNRAMIVTILWRLEGEPAATTASFSDVASGSWYTDAVNWAASEGIVKGYGDGYFGAMDAITREQLAAILWRYAKYKGQDVSVGEDTNILSYTDAFDISDWAYAPLQWACGAGVVDGKDGALAPQQSAVRVETAQMLFRFLQ